MKKLRFSRIESFVCNYIIEVADDVEPEDFEGHDWETLEYNIEMDTCQVEEDTVEDMEVLQ